MSKAYDSNNTTSASASPHGLGQFIESASIFDIYSARELRRKIGRKDISPVELVQECINSIESLNPHVNAVVSVDFEAALSAAQSAERAVSEDRPLGRLHGLPIVIKDLTDTAGLRTTYGSPQFAEHVPAEDEHVVASIRRSGAIIVGKSNVPEFGAGGHTATSVFGVTRNPFDLRLTSAGSSGGAAAALAAGMVPLATGSDNGGSSRTPAAFCGVVGFRPSAGVIASDRRSTAFNPLTVEGPMANCVEDAALLLSAMMGDNPADPLAWLSEPHQSRELSGADLGGLRVAVSEDLGFAPVDDTVRGVFRDRCRQFSRFFRSVEKRDPPLDDADGTYRVLRAEGYLTKHLETYRSNKSLLGSLVRSNVEEALTYSYEDFARANATRTEIYRRFQRFFRDFDILICPTAAVPPFPVEHPYAKTVNGEPMASYMDWMALTYGLTVTGHPVLALPCGRDGSGLPFGIQVCGSRRSDFRLLAIGAELERAFSEHAELAKPKISQRPSASGNTRCKSSE